MKHTGKSLFFLAVAVLLYGFIKSAVIDLMLGRSIGTVPMDSYYMLAIAIFAASAAAELIWGERR